MNIIQWYLPKTQIGQIAVGTGLVLGGVALLVKNRLYSTSQSHSVFRWSVTALGVSAVCLGIYTIAMVVLLNQSTILDANNPLLQSINDELTRLTGETSPAIGLAKLRQLEERLGELFKTQFDEITVSGMLLVQMTFNRIRDLYVQFNPLDQIIRV